MDGMALLCNLHADGPETLRSLREEGCTTLEELHQLGAERLAELVGFTPAAARRFLREGRILLERLAGAGLEGEEPLGAPAPLTQREPRRVDLPGNEQAILARVLERWREVEPPGAAQPAAPPAPRPAVVAGEEPQAPSSAPADAEALRPGCVEGLDADHCRALAVHGIRTLAQLAERSAEEVARATGLRFTRARRLQFLARRGAASDLLPAREPAPRRQVACSEKISLAFPDLPPAPLSPAAEPASGAVQHASTAADGERDAPGGPFA